MQLKDKTSVLGDKKEEGGEFGSGYATWKMRHQKKKRWEIIIM